MNYRVALAFFAVIIAGGGAFAWTRAQAIRRVNAPIPVAPPVEPDKHKVTPEMQRGADERAKRPAPPFHQEDGEGVTRDLGEMLKAGPIVLVFIKDGCPCSISAEAYFNAIHSAYRGRVQFLGVIEGDAAVARRWASANGVPFPILPDPELKLTKAYGATNSAFVALIDRSGSVVEFWPGYSLGMLRDLNQRVASMMGIEVETVEFADAPDDLYSGCPFNES